MRVHQGPSASAVVGTDRGIAFGAHIFLGAGESCATAESFAVLAHEVAYVLQQTAVLTEVGRLRARDVSGSGEALAWEAPFPEATSRPDTTIHLTRWRNTAEAEGQSDAVERIDALLAALAAAGNVESLTMADLLGVFNQFLHVA